MAETLSPSITLDLALLRLGVIILVQLYAAIIKATSTTTFHMLQEAAFRLSLGSRRSETGE